MDEERKDRYEDTREAFDEIESKEKKPKWIFVLLAFLLIGGAAAGWYFLSPAVKFTTSAPAAEAGEEFDPLSIIDKVRGGSASDVEVNGPLGKLEKGEYTYTYTYKGKDYPVTVSVKDTKAPVLKIKEEDPSSSEEAAPVFNDREPVDPALIVDVSDYGKVTLTLDDMGNDLTKVGTYNVTVRAEDEDGNKSEITAEIDIHPYDTVAPVISGAGDVYVKVWSGFDPSAGVSVTDDKDPNPVLTIDNNGFDTSTSTVGTYTVIYTAKDEYGNESKVERKITVYDIPYYYPSSNASVYWDCSGEWQPYLVAVNRSQNCLTVYGKDGYGNYTVPIIAFPCSTAREGYNTPISTNVPGGRFHSAWRADWCYMVDGSWGRYAISIDTSLAPDPYDRWGIMFHSVCYYSQSINDLEYDEYNKLGGPASLGCIRLCVANEKWLYDNCPEGFPIVIYDDSTSPGPLGKPDPIRIDTSDGRRGWDPTDPDPNNPW